MAKAKNPSRSQEVKRGDDVEQAEACSLDQGECEEMGGILSTCHRDVNVGEAERILSVMGGGVLAVFGAARGGLMGLGLTVLGGSLLYRGVTGHCEAYHVLGVDTSDSDAKQDELPAGPKTARA